MKHTAMTEALGAYISQNHSFSNDAILNDLRARTELLGDISGMLTSAEQSTLLTILVAASGARTAVEIGTFTGYSAICIARGLPESGRLHCFDISEEWTSIAREYWAKAGLDNQIKLTLGDARETLRNWNSDAPIDFAYIDADKTGYNAYYEALLPLMRSNALIVFDNMLRNGRVADENLTSEDDIALDALNRKLARDPRVQSVLLPVGDGINVCRKLAS